MMTQLKSVYPISGEDTMALPVQEIDPAVRFYTSVLGFKVVTQDDESAVLMRDAVEIGLIQNADHNPEEAGSLAFAVVDLDAMHTEISANAGNPGKFGTEEWDGKRFRTFFVREDQDGYCFCFHHPL